jgi:CRP-like cAMP-binding protein
MKIYTMIPRQSCENKILNALPESIYMAWQAHFEEVYLPESQVLIESGQSSGHVYFPLEAIVSWQYLLENGDCTEIAMVGREGLVGLYLLLGSNSNPNQGVVQTAGRAIRMRLHVVLNSFNLGPEVQRLMLCFMQSMIHQMGQGNVCRQHHSIEQRLCRMLLMILDRQSSMQVHKTHEALSQLLGVRREAVSLAAGRLMKEGLIRYTRGSIEVLDRPGLEQQVCECYGVVRQGQQLLCHAHPARFYTETI